MDTLDSRQGIVEHNLFPRVPGHLSPDSAWIIRPTPLHEFAEAGMERFGRIGYQYSIALVYYFPVGGRCGRL